MRRSRKKAALALGVALVVLGAILALVPSADTFTPAGPTVDPSSPWWQFRIPVVLDGGSLVRIRWHSETWLVSVILLRFVDLDQFNLRPDIVTPVVLGSGRSGTLDASIRDAGSYVLGLKILEGTGTWDVNPRMTISRPLAYLWQGSLVALGGAALVIAIEVGAAERHRRPWSPATHATYPSPPSPWQDLQAPPSPVAGWVQPPANPSPGLPPGQIQNPPWVPPTAGPPVMGGPGCPQCGAPLGPPGSPCPTCGFPQPPGPPGRL